MRLGPHQRNQGPSLQQLYRPLATSLTPAKQSEQFLLQQFKVTGTSRKLEKCFLRLTCLPDPSTVRPYGVLRQSLVHVMRKYLSGEEDHNYILGRR